MLGFIAADGCVRNTGKLTININYNDIEILYKFCELVSLDKKYIQHIKQKNKMVKSGEYDCAYLFVGSSYMIDVLAGYGIVENKSRKNVDFLLNIPRDFWASWITGYIDGDGCFYINNVCKRVTITSNFITLTEIAFFYARYNIKSDFEDRLNNNVTGNLVISNLLSAVQVAEIYLRSCTCQLKRKRVLAERIVTDYYKSFHPLKKYLIVKELVPEFLFEKKYLIIQKHKNNQRH